MNTAGKITLGAVGTLFFAWLFKGGPKITVTAIDPATKTGSMTFEMSANGYKYSNTVKKGDPIVITPSPDGKTIFRTENIFDDTPGGIIPKEPMGVDFSILAKDSTGALTVLDSVSVSYAYPQNGLPVKA